MQPYSLEKKKINKMSATNLNDILKDLELGPLEQFHEVDFIVLCQKVICEFPVGES